MKTRPFYLRTPREIVQLTGIYHIFTWNTVDGWNICFPFSSCNRHWRSEKNHGFKMKEGEVLCINDITHLVKEYRKRRDHQGLATHFCHCYLSLFTFCVESESSFVSASWVISGIIFSSWKGRWAESTRKCGVDQFRNIGWKRKLQEWNSWYFQLLM